MNPDEPVYPRNPYYDDQKNSRNFLTGWLGLCVSGNEFSLCLSVWRQANREYFFTEKLLEYQCFGGMCPVGKQVVICVSRETHFRSLGDILMKTKNMLIVNLGLVALAVLVGLLVYSRLPGEVASHWDIEGNVNGYMSRFWGVFLMPIVIAAFTLLLWGLPEIDPLKGNIDKFRADYNNFIVVMGIYFFFIHILTLLVNLGIVLDLNRFVIPAMGLFVFFLGGLLGKARRNWFVGIRTPWTLSSEQVWDKTHHLGGILFKITGVVILLGVFFPKANIWLLLGAILLPVFVLIGYSFLEFRAETTGKK